MGKKSKKQAVATPPGDGSTAFQVDSGGTLSMAGYREAEIRAEFYEDVADVWADSPQSLADAMARCQPLAWAVQAIYEEFRQELVWDLREAKDAGDSHTERRAALEERLETMPDIPEEGAADWLLTLGSREFDAWVRPEIEAWFGSSPDGFGEEDYLPETGTAQGAALDYFRSMDDALLRRLGVRVVEGEHPGSTYWAAELAVGIDEANRAAQEAGIPVRFVPAKG